MEKHTSTMPSCNKSRVTEFKLNESNALANTKANGRSATFVYLFDMIHYNILNSMYCQPQKYRSYALSRSHFLWPPFCVMRGLVDSHTKERSNESNLIQKRGRLARAPADRIFVWVTAFLYESAKAREKKGSFIRQKRGCTSNEMVMGKLMSNCK